MDILRHQAVVESKSLSAQEAVAGLTTTANPFCGSEGLHSIDDDSCVNASEFSSLKAELYKGLAPITSKIAQNTAHELKAATSFDESPIAVLLRSLNESFDDLYLSLEIAAPPPDVCSHFQDLEYVVRPGIHTAAVAMDVLMTHLEWAEKVQEYAKASRLIQRLALLHTDSLPVVLARLSDLSSNGISAVRFDGPRLEFVAEFDAFLSKREEIDEANTRLGCPVMFDASSMRELWLAYGNYYTKNLEQMQPVR